MSEVTRKPSIRFKNFADPWEQRKLSSICEKFTDGDWIEAKDQSLQGVRLIQTGNVGVTTFIDKPDNQKWVSEDTFQNLHCEEVFPGDILISRLPEPAGRACIMPVLPTKMITAVDCTIARINKENCADFIVQYLSSQVYFDKVNTCLAGGTRQRIGRSALADFDIPVPQNTNEQKQIGSFFKQIDTLITLHQRKYDKLVTIKKSCLEKMFPKNGSKFPEVRFKGFTDPWEQRKLSEIAISFEYGLNAAAKEFDGSNKYLRITDIDDDTRAFKNDDLTSPDTNLQSAENYLLQEGDILFARTGASVGKTYIYKHSDGISYFAGFLIRMKLKEKFCPEFVFQNTLTDGYKKFIQITSQRSGQPGVNSQEYGSYEILLPTIEEQKKIGDFFKQLDTLITLHQRELEKLQNLKKACLEKMFL